MLAFQIASFRRFFRGIFFPLFSCKGAAQVLPVLYQGLGWVMSRRRMRMELAGTVLS